MFPTYAQLQQLFKDRQVSAARSAANALLTAASRGRRRTPRRSR